MWMSLALWMARGPGDAPMARATPPELPPSNERSPTWGLGGRPAEFAARDVGLEDVTVVGSFTLHQTSCPAVIAAAGVPLRELATRVDPSPVLDARIVRVWGPALDQDRPTMLVVVLRTRAGAVRVSALTEVRVLAGGSDEDSDGVSNGDDVHRRLNPLGADADGARRNPALGVCAVGVDPAGASRGVGEIEPA